MSPAGSDLPPRQPHLPPELIHCITENCDKHSLPNCSLVSRTWHSIAAPLLYSNLSICLEDGRKKFSDFLSFLQEGTHLARHVKFFKVERGLLDVYQLIRLFGYFPHLQDLAMGRTILEPARVVDSAPPSLPIPHLKSLTIRFVSVFHNRHPWSALFDLINSFSAVDKLVLDSLWSQGYRRQPPPNGLTTIAPGGKARVGELVFLPEILGEAAEVFIGAMAEHLNITQIHTLETTQWFDRDSFEQVMAMFRGVRHVRFLMKQTFEGYYVPLPTSWSSLESITFSTKLPEPGSYFEDKTFDRLQEAFSSSLGALSSIPQASRAQLFTIRYELFGKFLVKPGGLNRHQYLKQLVENVDWPSLGSILNEDTFRELRVVEVSLTVSEVFPDEMSIAERHAKEVTEREVLVGMVKDRLSKLKKGCAVNVLVSGA